MQQDPALKELEEVSNRIFKDYPFEKPIIITNHPMIEVLQYVPSDCIHKYISDDNTVNRMSETQIELERYPINSLIYIVLKVDTITSAITLNSWIKTHPKLANVCTILLTTKKRTSAEEVALLKIAFRGFLVSQYEFVYELVRSTDEMIVVEQDMVNDLLWNPVILQGYSWNHETPYNALQYVLYTMLPKEKWLYPEEPNHMERKCQSITREIDAWVRNPENGLRINKNDPLFSNLYYYEVLMKYMFWIIYRNTSIADMNKERKLISLVQDAFEDYFYELLQTKTRLLEYLLSVYVKDTSKKFLFQEFMFDQRWSSFIEDSTVQKKQPFFNLAKYSKPESGVNAWYEVDILVKTNVISDALCRVLRHFIVKQKQPPQQGDIRWNSIIKDQMERVAKRLSLFLTGTVTPYQLHYIVDSVWECDFRKKSPIVYFDVARRIDNDYLKGDVERWISKQMKQEEKELVVSVLYQYACYSYDLVSGIVGRSGLDETEDNISAKLIELRGEKGKPLSPDTHSMVFPYVKGIAGQLLESFFEFVILYMDMNETIPISSLINDKYVKKDTSKIEKDLAFFMDSDEGVKTVWVQPVPLEHMNWFTKEVVYHMLHENDIYVNMGEAETIYDICLSFMSTFYDEKTNKSVFYKFIRSFFNRKHIVPMEKMDEYVFPDVVMRVSLSTELAQLRQKITWTEPVRQQVQKLELMLRESPSDELYNRLILLTRFQKKQAREMKALVFPEKSVLDKLLPVDKMSSKTLYELYEKRALLLLSQETFDSLCLLHVQSMMERVHKSGEFSEQDIRRFLYSMNEYTISSIALTYSVLIKYIEEPNSLFMMMNSDQTKWIQRLRSHYVWIMETSKQIPGFDQFVISGSWKDMLESLVSFHIRDDINPLCPKTTIEYVGAKVAEEEQHMRMIAERAIVVHSDAKDEPIIHSINELRKRYVEPAEMNESYMEKLQKRLLDIRRIQEMVRPELREELHEYEMDTIRRIWCYEHKQTNYQKVMEIEKMLSYYMFGKPTNHFVHFMVIMSLLNGDEEHKKEAIRILPLLSYIMDKDATYFPNHPEAKQVLATYFALVQAVSRIDINLVAVPEVELPNPLQD
jgi:hypothetical protein